MKEIRVLANVYLQLKDDVDAESLTKEDIEDIAYRFLSASLTRVKLEPIDDRLKDDKRTIPVPGSGNLYDYDNGVSFSAYEFEVQDI